MYIIMYTLKHPLYDMMQKELFSLRIKLWKILVTLTFRNCLTETFLSTLHGNCEALYLRVRVLVYSYLNTGTLNAKTNVC